MFPCKILITVPHPGISESRLDVWGIAYQTPQPPNGILCFSWLLSTLHFCVNGASSSAGLCWAVVDTGPCCALLLCALP